MSLNPLAALSQDLIAPFNIEKTRQISGKPFEGSYECPAAPDPVINLMLPAYYESDDSTASHIDTKAFIKHQQIRQPLREFESNLLKITNAYIASKPAKEDIALCAVNWLKTWAERGALLGNMSYAGKHVRKWSAGTLAAAYLQIKQSPSLTPKAAYIIETWLKQLADILKQEQQAIVDQKSGQNNHLYWKAWSVGLIAVALQERDLFSWAMSKAQIGLYQISEEGALPLELKRGKKALQYHIFSAHALVMLAELAAVNNAGDFYAVNNKALQKLISLTLESFDNPARISRKAGQEQDTQELINGSTMAWLEIYARRRPDDKRAQAYLTKLRPFTQTRTGGNMTLLFYNVPLD